MAPRCGWEKINQCFATLFLLTLFLNPLVVRAQQTNNLAKIAPQPSRTIPVWNELAPGETTREPGTQLPSRPADSPTITRVEKITQPTLDVFLAKQPTGAAVLILPGGGFRYVVPDLEGSEAAAWLNDLAISVFVLRYLTTDAGGADPWKRPLQDSQRALRIMRSRAAEWQIDPGKIGLFGFSAGGQVAAIHLTSSTAAYPAADAIDQLSFRPDFSLLVYPWKIYDETKKQLIAPIHVSTDTPPAFIVHTHDDASTALGAVFYYAGLKQHGVAAELHVYQNGGHGYGTRPRPDSMIGTWKDRATEWLKINKL